MMGPNMEITMCLRFNKCTNGRSILQQQFRNIETGLYEWHDVPQVIPLEGSMVGGASPPPVEKPPSHRLITTDSEEMREAFEGICRHDSMGFKRSRKGTYVNPATAQKWRWFMFGAMYQMDKEAEDDQHSQG